MPQGSVLGPLLFVLYANDLQLQLSLNLVQYADDTFLFKNVTTDVPDSLLQKDLNTIVYWAKLNCLRLNADKCKSIRLTWRRMSKPEYNLGNSPLECVDSIKLLGCIFQSNLSWDLQVQAVTSKCNRLIGLILLISGNCPSCVSLHLFKTLVQPILDYCSPVWWILRKKKISSIKSVQRRESKMILRQKYMEPPYQERLKTLGLMLLSSDRRIFLNICFIVKLLMSTRYSFMNDLTNLSKVNSRHTELLTFHHLKPRTDAYKFSTFVRFPKMFSELTLIPGMF